MNPISLRFNLVNELILEEVNRFQSESQTASVKFKIQMLSALQFGSGDGDDILLLDVVVKKYLASLLSK